MAETILYSFRRCPYAMRARMALSSSGLEYEHREVVLRDKPPEMLEVSPKGTVPVLLTETGTVIEESLDIMRHALAVKDPEGWLEHDDPELVAANDGPFKHHLDRYKYATRYEGADAETHRDAALDYLRTLDARLRQTPQLFGPAMSLADAAIFPFVRQFAHTDRAWFDALDLPGLQAWLAGHLASPRFADIMVKHAPWSPPG